MNTPIENGLTATNSQPAKTHSKTNPDCTANSEAPATKLIATDAVTTGDSGHFGNGDTKQFTLFETPEFCPQWPTKGTLADIALCALMDGKLIDHNDLTVEQHRHVDAAKTDF